MSSEERKDLPRATAETPQFQLYKSPNPNWTLGQRVDATEAGREWMAGAYGENAWTVVDPAIEDTRRVYGLLTSCVSPRPVAFVSSISESGVENVAPFSWFNTVSSNPATISISCTASGADNQKDTARNIKATKGFTVNIISEAWIENANACSVDSPPNTSEWELSGLTKEKSTFVKAPRVLESALSMECELFQAIDIPRDDGVLGAVLIVGRIKLIHARKDILNERGICDLGKLKPVARGFGIAYTRTREGYELRRPQWADIQAQYDPKV